MGDMIEFGEDAHIFGTKRRGSVVSKCDISTASICQRSSAAEPDAGWTSKGDLSIISRARSPTNMSICDENTENCSNGKVAKPQRKSKRSSIRSSITSTPSLVEPQAVQENSMRSMRSKPSKDKKDPSSGGETPQRAMRNRGSISGRGSISSKDSVAMPPSCQEDSIRTTRRRASTDTTEPSFERGTPGKSTRKRGSITGRLPKNNKESVAMPPSCQEDSIRTSRSKALTDKAPISDTETAFKSNKNMDSINSKLPIPQGSMATPPSCKDDSMRSMRSRASTVRTEASSGGEASVRSTRSRSSITSRGSVTSRNSIASRGSLNSRSSLTSRSPVTVDENTEIQFRGAVARIHPPTAMHQFMSSPPLPLPVAAYESDADTLLPIETKPNRARRSTSSGLDYTSGIRPPTHRAPRSMSDANTRVGFENEFTDPFEDDNDINDPQSDLRTLSAGPPPSFRYVTHQQQQQQHLRQYQYQQQQHQENEESEIVAHQWDYSDQEGLGIPPPPPSLGSPPTYDSGCFDIQEYDVMSTSFDLRSRARDVSRSDEEKVERLRLDGFTRGLAEAVVANSTLFDYRIWIVDNSGSMQIGDGHRIVAAKKKKRIEFKPVKCTRWEELQETIRYHSKMATRMDTPTVFKFLNDPGVRVGTQQFSVAERGQEFYQEDVENAMSIMRNVKPDGVTPLTDHILDIQRGVSAIADELLRVGKKVVVVLATDGLPTDCHGFGNDETTNDFMDALRSLEGLPVWLVIRLCTDEEPVTNFYNALDGQMEISLEVLDDFIGEAEEVYKYNKWLNYALPIHRCREMGYHDRLFDFIDERTLTVGEIREFCCLLFGVENSLQVIPDPATDFVGFLKAVHVLLESEPKQWNPVKRKMMPWIDLRALSKMYGDGANCSIM